MSSQQDDQDEFLGRSRTVAQRNNTELAKRGERIEGLMHSPFELHDRLSGCPGLFHQSLSKESKAVTTDIRAKTGNMIILNDVFASNL
jgi:hypothetical protein